MKRCLQRGRAGEKETIEGVMRRFFLSQGVSAEERENLMLF